VLRTGLVRPGTAAPKPVAVFLGCKVACAVLLPVLWIGYASAHRAAARQRRAVDRDLRAVGFYLPSDSSRCGRSSARSEIAVRAARMRST
jgi:hypothetical protein